MFINSNVTHFSGWFTVPLLMQSQDPEQVVNKAYRDSLVRNPDVTAIGFTKKPSNRIKNQKNADYAANEAVVVKVKDVSPTDIQLKDIFSHLK